MGRTRTRYFVADFETTVYDGQTRTDVWAAGLVEFNSERFVVDHSIAEHFDRLCELRCNIILFYHNLKFDGSFWLEYLPSIGYRPSLEDPDPQDKNKQYFRRGSDLRAGEYCYSISDRGQWYTISIKTWEGYGIEIRDSLKLLPFSVKELGKSFGTKHKKLEMEYKGFRYPGCPISDEEMRYIGNDLLVVKEALEIMQKEGHLQLTIGACCLQEFKRPIDKSEYNELYPNLYEKNEQLYKLTGIDSYGKYIRRAYHGGWCYLVDGASGVLQHDGGTVDVNSLYPSVMHSESGCRYPIGQPTFWQGDYIPEEALRNNRYYFVRIQTQFYIKPGYLPCIQIKGNFRYRGTEWLKTSDIYKNGRYWDTRYNFDGEIVPNSVEMVLTCTDWELIKEHYDLVNCKILDGCYFDSAIGIFDLYINKYRKIKMESKGAQRTEAKLFLNNLYGKMAASTDSSFKVAQHTDKGLSFYSVASEDKTPGYIPIGAAITSYARNFTIRAAQKNWHGLDRPGFRYADTDSLHYAGMGPEDLIGVPLDKAAFCCWKPESQWDFAMFSRQKTYVEHITHEELEPVERPYYDVKCAGMPAASKAYFIDDLESGRKTLADFRPGLQVPGKLIPRQIPGGVLLVETTFTMKN